jgi:transposase
MSHASPLPDDVETLKAMLLSPETSLPERDAQMLRLQEPIDSQHAASAWPAEENEHLKLLIAELRRMQFGRKSETLDS